MSLLLVNGTLPHYTIWAYLSPTRSELKREPSDSCNACRLKYDAKTGLAPRPKTSIVTGVAASISFRYRLRDPDKNQRVAGYYLPTEDPLIKIDTYQSPKNQRQAMAHEVMHQLLTLLEPNIKLEIEERICRSVELMVEYCDENPAVRDFIFYPKVSHE